MSGAGRRLAVLKPDFGGRGGFERHLDGLVERLADKGWSITIETIDATTRPSELRGLPVTEEMLHHHDDFFLLMGLIERVRSLDLTPYDVVLTTQPPTYLADHPKKVALFYHHARQFYDLANRFEGAGFSSTGLHQPAVDTVRAAEAEIMGDSQFTAVHEWLAGSATVAARLQEFWDVDPASISVYSAPPDTSPTDRVPRNPAGPALVVSRHEWPKRVELVAAAINLAGAESQLVVVGDGTRRAVSAQIDADWAAATPSDPSPERLWQHAGAADPSWRPATQPPSGRIEWVTEATDSERDQRYREASMVVCPAYQEDYGLTALEAMAWGRPVIVCSDGGGLTEFVEHNVNGLVVDPTPAAIAGAIDRLRADPDFADRLGTAGIQTVVPLTWERSVNQVDAALQAALKA